MKTTIVYLLHFHLPYKLDACSGMEGRPQARAPIKE
jgi:hypothetical protein